MQLKNPGAIRLQLLNQDSKKDCSENYRQGYHNSTQTVLKFKARKLST